jgi:hypothetical protein
MLPDGIVAYLAQQPSITAIVVDRIQPIPAPADIDSFLPGITYQSPSDISENANDGPVGLATMRIVFDCFAQRYLDARNLARALKAVLNGFAGDLPDGTHVELTQSVNIVDRFDDGSRIYCSTVHWLLQYRD